MSKRIVLSGYYGFDNLGDEAVLQSIIQALRAEDSSLEILVLSKNPEKTSERYGVKAVDRWKMGEVFKALRWSDLLISGGGSLLQDVTSQMTIPYYLGVVGMARALGKKVAFYAQGVGPIEKGFGRRLTHLVANRVKLITVRDQESLNLLKDLGIKRPELEVTVDPVVLLRARAKPTIPENEEYHKILELKKKCLNEDRPLIGIAPRPWKGLKKFQQSLIEVAKRLQAEDKAEILLIPMHIGQDLDFCLEMAQELSNVNILREFYQPDELLSVYQELDFLIGIRLHALIFSAVCNVAHLGISYDPKIDSFLRRIGDKPISSVEKLDTEILYREVVERLHNRQFHIDRIETAMTNLKKIAQENAQMVLKLLN
ncbi:MAG: polysaccharide pyruvyl transferase CsaB [Halanaerobiales bacterium]|nr:polysaccharide pyruvyl transferase CsaB [Halanaerobiales bacterium]